MYYEFGTQWPSVTQLRSTHQTAEGFLSHWNSTAWLQTALFHFFLQDIIFFFYNFQVRNVKALANKTRECMFTGCYKLFILEVLLLYRENQSNYFSVCCSAVNVAINSNTVQWTDNNTHTGIIQILIWRIFQVSSHIVWAVGGICWMSMWMCETSWHLQHLQGRYLNQHYTSVSVYPSSLFLKADPWHSITVCFCHSNRSPSNQWSHTNPPVIYSGDRLFK